MSKECNHVFVDEDGSKVEQVKVKKGCSKLLAIQCIQDREIVLTHFTCFGTRPATGSVATKSCFSALPAKSAVVSARRAKGGECEKRSFMVDGTYNGDPGN